MTTAQKIEKLEKEVRNLRALVSALVPLDAEGEYRPEFLNTLKKRSGEKPAGYYTGKGSLLSRAAR